MKTETIKIGNNATLKTYIWDDSEELAVTSRPAVLVLPGGGYTFCSDREAEPVAMAYMAEGFQTFVLRYTTVRKFEPAFGEAQTALDLIRENAARWHIRKNAVAVCGFSAGGHLACAMGVLAKNKPNAMILGYPAVIGKDWEKITEEVPDLVSRVGMDTAPCFITAACDDMVVPIQNAIALMEALHGNGVPFETHIYRQGGHGYSIAKNHTSCGEGEPIPQRVAQWFPNSVQWLKEVVGDVEFKEKTTLPDNLPEAIHRPIRELKENPRSNEILLKYSQGFANEVVLGIAAEAPASALVIPFGLSATEITDLANELEVALDNQ